MPTYQNMPNLKQNEKSSNLEEGLNNCEARYQAFEAKRKAKEQAERKAADIKRLGGIRQYEDFTAEKYTNTPILHAMRNYPKENYFLFGAAGTGKTHAAVAIARAVKNAQVIRMAQISRIFRKDISATQEEQYLTQFAQIPMVLDDLGSEKMTDFLQNILFEIIDRRWSAKAGGLIITANMNIPALAKIIGDRTTSRIAGLIGADNVLQFTGDDRRFAQDLF